MNSTNTITNRNVLNQVLAGTVAQVSNEFLIDCEMRRLSPNTLRSYRNELSAMQVWLDLQGVVSMDELSADVLRKYLLHLSERRNPGGQFAAYRVIRTLTFWWEKETDSKYLSQIRKVKPPKVSNQPLPGVSRDVVLELVESCAGKNTDRDRAILDFLADTGVRANELCNILVGDINLAAGSAEIRHGKGGKRRTVYFSQSTRKQLRKYLMSRPDLDVGDSLFVNEDGEPLKYGGLRQIVRRRAKDAGLPEPGLHDFRRFFALSMLRNGADLVSLSRLMGHSGITVLQRYLAQVDGDLQMVHRKASPVNW